MSAQSVRQTECNLQNFEIEKMFIRRGSDKCWNVPFVKRGFVADRCSGLLSELMLLTIKSISLNKMPKDLCTSILTQKTTHMERFLSPLKPFI